MEYKTTDKKITLLKSLNFREVLIKKEAEVKLYNSFNSAVIFLPSKHYGKKVNIYEVKD